MTEKFGTNLRLNIGAYLTENVTAVFWDFFGKFITKIVKMTAQELIELENESKVDHSVGQNF